MKGWRGQERPWGEAPARAATVVVCGRSGHEGQPGQLRQGDPGANNHDTLARGKT